MLLGTFMLLCRHLASPQIWSGLMFAATLPSFGFIFAGWYV